MYTHKKPFTEEFYNKSRKNKENMPSFSSSLLDEIYRSIDCKSDKTSKRHGVVLVENWMKIDDTISKRRDHESKSLHDNDVMFFSSTSCSSDSSGALSSSDTEFFGSSEGRSRPKVSCFARPKPVRTGCGESEPDRVKSKSRALKMYANLKKVKQPISPGGRLTSFINSLFSNSKSSKNVEKSKKGFDDVKSLDCPSSASSFSRSCLSKYSPKSREQMRNGEQRTVRFHPVSVIVDEDSRPCGQKSTYEEEFGKHMRPPLPPRVAMEGKMGRSRKVEEVGCNKKEVDEFSIFLKIHKREDEDEDDDCLSDASSDLFELDHLALFGDERFCEELPVYETTHLATNRAIASGLIR